LELEWKPRFKEASYEIRLLYSSLLLELQQKTQSNLLVGFISLSLATSGV
jgi:hypothetical protein